MALADNRRQRIVTLCALYVAQGVPWGFMVVAVVAFLTDNGVSATVAGELSAVVLLPWTFKLIWAPLIDSVTIRSMGRRRSWIIGAEIMMALTLLGLLAMGDFTRDIDQNVKLLGAMFFLHNVFASLQDVSTDALAVDVLPIEEQGNANGLMWGSKLVGKGLGATVMAEVMAHWGFQAAVLLQFVLLLLIMLLPLLILERRGEKRFPWSEGAAVDGGMGTGKRNPWKVMGDLFKGFSLTATLVFAVFAVGKLIGSGINEVAIKPLYTQNLGWDAVEYSRIGGMYVIIPSIIGAVAAGYIANRFGRRKVILFGFGSYGALALLFAAFPQLWQERWCTVSYLLLTEGLAAVGSVGFLSMAMRITWTQSAATMFTVYMTLSNLGHVIGNWLVGPVKQFFQQPLIELAVFQSQAGWITNYQQVFVAVALLNFLPLILLPLVDPIDVDRYKYPTTTLPESERLAVEAG